MRKFLRETAYIDLSNPNIQAKAAELFGGVSDNTHKARAAYEFVRDEIPHSFDINAKIITAKASDVLKHKTGICHAKANLLAALLRSQGIPTGFCFQHATLADNESLGYVIHCYNAVFLDGRWIKLDARGNKPGVNAQFSLEKPILAYPPRPEYDEYFWPGIYANPHMETMCMLNRAASLQDIIDHIPDQMTDLPDIKEDFQIKQAIRDELYGIAVFLDACWRAEYRQIVSDDFLDTMEVEARHKRLLKRYDEGLSEFLMMMDGDQLIGAVVFGKSFTEGYEGDGEISAIYLHKGYIGKGYGHDLFIKTEQLLREKGYTHLVLDLLADNTRALAFYIKHGYEKVDDRTIRLGETEYPLVVLRKGI